jgi:MFS transporter, DHA2 family, multidrug resistance protein
VTADDAKVSDERARAGPREWLGLAVIALPCLLYSMDLTVLNLAIPAMSAALKPSASELLWIIDIYGFLVAGMLMTMGDLGDRIGRRRLLTIGAAAFGLASLVAAWSTSPAMLIMMRALLGIAGATLAPSTLALVRTLFRNPEQRTTAIGIWIASYSAGAALGALLGGVLLSRFGWGSAFLIGVPVMLLLLVLAPRLLPEYRQAQTRAIDLVSVGLSIIGVLATMYGIKRIAADGFDAISVITLLAGLGIVWLFLHRQSQSADPMINLELFRIPSFSAALGAYTIGTFAAFGVFVFIGQYYQLVLDLSPLRAGLWTMPFAAAFILSSTLTPHLSRRTGPGDSMMGG